MFNKINVNIFLGRGSISLRRGGLAKLQKLLLGVDSNSKFLDNLLFSFDFELYLRDIIIQEKKFLIEITYLQLQTFELADIRLLMPQRFFKILNLSIQFVQFNLVRFVNFIPIFQNFIQMFYLLLHLPTFMLILFLPILYKFLLIKKLMIVLF